MSGLWLVVSLSFAGVLSAASDEIPSPCSPAGTLSSFDYLVLASMADAQRPIALASYRPASVEAHVSSSEVAVQLE
jgi:hypothetical protein